MFAAKIRDARILTGLDVSAAAHHFARTNAAQWRLWENGGETAPDAVLKTLERWRDCVCRWEEDWRGCLKQAEFHGDTVRLPFYQCLDDARNETDFVCWNALLARLPDGFPDTAVRGEFDAAAYRAWLRRIGLRDGTRNRLCWALNHSA